MKKLTALSLLLILLTGCASIPSAGPIQIINDKNAQADLNDVRVIAKPPTSRMNSIQIASGFVAANISTFGDFSVAREYMTTFASKSWYPKNFDVLDSTSIQYNDLGTGIVEISAIQIGKLKNNHRFEIFPVAKPFLLRLSIETARGGLRIANELPNGILASSDMVRGFSPYNVYFANEGFTKMVPEIVWFPKNEKSLATKLANVLISGSRESLRTAIPDGTDLRFGSVTISSGTAVVNLNASALMADNAQREFMIAQFVWTLQEIPGVGRVQIATNDRVLSTQGKAFFNRDNFEKLDPNFTKSDSGVFMLDKTYFSSLYEGLLTDIGRLQDVTVFSVSNNRKKVAYIKNGQLRVSQIAKLKQYTAIAENVENLSYDQQGRIWFTNKNGSLNCLPTSGQIQELTWESEQRIQDFAISPDSGRIALAVSNKAKSQLLVGTLISENGVLAIGSVRKVEQSLSGATKVEWLNSRDLIVIGKIGLRESVTAIVSLANGSLRNLNAPKPFVSISTSNQNTVIAMTKKSRVWIYEDNLWGIFDSKIQAVYSE